MELVKKEREFLQLLSSSESSNNSFNRLTSANKASLKEMVKYLTDLQKEKIISQDQLSELISLACANYIENEVEIRLDKVLTKKLFGKLFQII